jgi:flagellar hook-associated protein 2
MFSTSGLASGLDTNSMVTQLMTIERQPLIRLQQKQAVEEARQQALTDVRTRMANLQTSAATLADASLWNDTQDVTSSDTTHLTVARTSGAAAGGYTVAVTRLASADQYSQSSANTTALADDTLNIAVGAGSTFGIQLKAGDSLATIAGKINGTTDIPVYATVAGGKLVISAKATGDANTVSLTSGGAAGFAFTQTAAAHNALLTVDSGLGPVTVANATTNTITSAIAGVTITLKAPTTATITVGSPAPDTERVSAALQSFMDQYNSTVSFIRSELTEQPVAKPTTAADRAKGLLNGDPSLEALLTHLRQSVGDMVQGRPAGASTLAQIGVSTGSPSGTIDPDAVAGKLKLDNVKLTAALTSSFSDVKALFTNVTGAYATEGVRQRFQRVLDPYLTTGGIMDGRAGTSTSNLTSIKAQELDWGPRLTAKEASLRKQFTAMEVALSKSQSLSASISNQLLSLSSGIRAQ